MVATEFTKIEAGQRIGRSTAQVDRLIALGELRARRDERGWWRIDAASIHEFVERARSDQPAPAA